MNSREMLQQIIAELGPDQVLEVLHEAQGSTIEQEPRPEVRGLLPSIATRTAYERALVRLYGSEVIMSQTLIDSWGREIRIPSGNGHYRYSKRGQAPFGGSWFGVKGQPQSNLLAKHRREHNRWLKKVERQCRENPSPTFKYNPPDCKRPGCTAEEVSRGGKVRSIDDAMVQLQLLGVTV